MTWPSKDPADYSKPGRWEGRAAPAWLRTLGRLLFYAPDRPPTGYTVGALAVGLVLGMPIAVATGREGLCLGPPCCRG